MLAQYLYALLGLIALAEAAVVVVSPYAPVPATCPKTPLVRPAKGLSSSEAAYRARRKKIADAALKQWLSSLKAGFDVGGSMPTIALTTSGGGYRSLLVGAGVIQGLDARDSKTSVSGLYQALTYEAGLSGGGWLLSSLAGNDWPTVTSLKENLWKPAFEVSLLLPNNLLAAEAYPMVTRDIVAKEAAGYPPTLVDPWGRLLSYQLLYGPDGGVTKTMSSVSAMSNLTSAAVPLPFITALGVKTFNGECLPGPNATQYEFSPYEFGSWDRDVSAFTPTRYLGTSLDNGKPTGAQCTANYDNLGYVLGTSSALFNNACQDVPPSPSNNNLTNTLAAIVAIAHKTTTRDEYAVYPNPFYHYYSPSGKRNPANDVPSQKELDLVDGGEALQNNPLWPFLQPARGIDVIIANDNSADDANNFPNGTEILTTYVQSLSAGLTRMPFIPSVDVFVSKGLNKRATAFGCDDNSKITVVWIPNVNYTYPSNQPTAKLQYSRAETDGMVGDGVAVATQNGDGDWGLCLRCLVVKKTAKKLPAGCAACFERYCYRP